MNTLLRSRSQATEAFPLQLPPPTSMARRLHIGQVALNDDAIADFNQTLHAVNAQAPSVQADQLASLARWMHELPAEIAAATISERLARVEALRKLLQDADWSVRPEFAERARRLLGYLQRLDDLIPDDVPVIGHLDDALLVELSWQEFAGEVQDFLDYCRFRDETKPRGNASERRTAWETQCLLEASALLHRREVQERGYARPAPIDRPFRVY